MKAIYSNTTSLINASFTLVNPQVKDYNKEVRKRLCFAFSMEVARCPVLSQMEGNIIADYFTMKSIM